MWRISFITLVLLSSIACSETLVFPEIDWQALDKTKPWERTEDWTSVKRVDVANAQQIPSDAIVLFSGNSQEAWHRAQWPVAANMAQIQVIAQGVDPGYVGEPASWKIANGTLEVSHGAIATKRAFGSVQLHIEWLVPELKGKSGQFYGNSGVFLMGLYEVQILNSYNNPTYSNGQAGSAYKQFRPLVNASLPPGQWQSYDIIFTAPSFDKAGRLNTPAYMTVFHNGVIIQNHVKLQGPTLYIGDTEYVPHAPKMPLVLQDHGDPVQFRNIWIREL